MQLYFDYPVKYNIKYDKNIIYIKFNIKNIKLNKIIDSMINKLKS